jgi:Trk-type K+ transport system membrane component
MSFNDDHSRTRGGLSLPVAVAVVLGGIGFPVLFELRRNLRRPARWTMHTKITLIATGVLLVAGTAFMLAAEWSNPGTLGPFNVPGKLLAGFFQGVMPRAAPPGSAASTWPR